MHNHSSEFTAAFHNVCHNTVAVNDNFISFQKLINIFSDISLVFYYVTIKNSLSIYRKSFEGFFVELKRLIDYNKKHNITPKTIIKDIQEDSSTKTKSYTATDQFIIELSMKICYND